MPHKFIHVGFRFDGPSVVKDFETLFSVIAEDWMRYADNCWLLYTPRSATDVYWFLKPYLGENDQMLILGVDMGERNGWMAKWVWEWIDKKRELGPPPEPAPPPPDWARGLLGLAADPNLKPSSGLLSGLGGLGQPRGGILGEHLDPSDDQKKR